LIPIFFFTMHQQLRHRFSQQRVDTRACYFRKRHKDKEPLRHSRMGEGQLFGTHNQVVVEEEIKIQGPVLMASRLRLADAAVTGLNGLEAVEQLIRRQPGADKTDRIDEPVRAVHAHRLTAIRGRKGRRENFGMLLQISPSGLQQQGGLAEIGAQADDRLVENTPIGGGVHGKREGVLDRQTGP